MRCRNFTFYYVVLLIYRELLKCANNPFFDVYRKNRYDYRLFPLDCSDTNIIYKGKQPVPIAKRKRSSQLVFISFFNKIRWKTFTRFICILLKMV